MNAELPRETALRVQDAEPQSEQETNLADQSSVSIALSLSFILTGAGAKFKGNAAMQRTTTSVPRRASRPADTDDLSDQQQLGVMPRSAIRWRPTNQTQAGQDVLAPHGCTQDATVPVVSHRVSGSTRVGLWVVLLLCIAFLINGIVLPAFVNLANQWHYGDARVATYDLQHHHFLTEDYKGKIRVYVITEDGQHVQVLDSILSSNVNHALVTLTDQGNSIMMSVNGVQTALLVPDGQGNYKWGGN